MSTEAGCPTPKTRRPWAFPWLPAMILAVLALAGVFGVQRWADRFAQAVAAEAPPLEEPSAQPEPANDSAPGGRIRAPELDGGVAWLNSGGPIRLQEDLHGKIVVLDFWTLCCINCIHTLPDLARLEEKYPNQLVVIGVHSAKFNNEKNSESIRKAIARYEIRHPVINDANMAIWQRYAVNSWPTIYVIDPEGFIVGRGSGEGLGEALDQVIGRLIKLHREKKTLDETPLNFNAPRFRERATSPLYFPGKVLAHAPSQRLFIADSTHHRIVTTDLSGKKIAIAGTGEPGYADGSFEQARFNDPQGMALAGDTLYVADRKNHRIRALDLKAQTVRTIAGTGTQGTDRMRGGPALRVGLNSPWDLFLQNQTLYMAMAGFHQIWTLDLEKNVARPYAGNGYENIKDGTLEMSSFAQPSGLTSDGKTLFVADSEVSAVRAVAIDGRDTVKTIVGEGLFEFGDHDGVGQDVRLQHALGVAFHDGLIYVADTYNSKIKVIDPVKQSCRTLIGDKGWLADSPLNEPGGLSFAGDLLYVADTNHHRIRVIDIAKKTVSTLRLQGVEPPRQEADAIRPTFPNPVRSAVPMTVIADQGELTLQVELHLPAGFKLNPDAKTSYLVEALPNAKKPWSRVGTIAESQTSFRVPVDISQIRESGGVQLSVVYYECGKGSNAVCRVKSQIWEIPLRFDHGSTNRSIQLENGLLTKGGQKG